MALAEFVGGRGSLQPISGATAPTINHNTKIFIHARTGEDRYAYQTPSIHGAHSVISFQQQR